MSKSVVSLLVLAFLITSCLLVARPVLSTANIVEDSWTSKTPMQKARGGLGVAAVNGKIYAIGGSAQDAHLATVKEFLSTNEEYDPETDAWTFKKPMPTPRAVFATAVYQNKIYCIGGKTSSGYTGVNEVYDPSTDTWETKSSMPTARGWLTASVVGAEIYLIGGSPYPSGTLNEVYDPTTDSWTKKTPAPSGAYFYASAVVDNKIYVIGRYNQIYDAETDSWSLGADGGGGVAGATSGVLAPERIYVFGEASTQAYNTADDNWTAGVSMPTARMNFGVAVVDDVLYTIGGYTHGDLYLLYGVGPFAPSAVIEQYTPFGYGTVPPSIEFVSPGKQRYNASSVSLVFTVNKPVVWLGYSLDGQENVTINGNTILSRLSNGLHNVTVYAEDSFGNMGTSDTVSFSVEVPFPTALVAAASAISATIGVGLLVYFRKRRH